MKLIPSLPDYSDIIKFLDQERKSFVKVNTFSSEDLPRSLHESELIVKALEKIQTELRIFFKNYPSLLNEFEREFDSFLDFIHRERVLEICFFDDYFFPEKEKFLLINEKGEVDPKLLDEYELFFKDWTKKIESNHQETQKVFKESFSTDMREQDLQCRCHTCVADYRSKLRDQVYYDSLKHIENYKQIIASAIPEGIEKVSSEFYYMQKELDKTIFKLRHRLKRSSLTRLETQLKTKLKEAFVYPSELSKEYVKFISEYWDSLLEQEEVNTDLITLEEYDKFYHQLGVNLWRNKKFLEREFKKLVKSLLLLKRTDISSAILKDYLGNFWIHSPARQIRRRIVYHMGPTNSGKTYHAIERLAEMKKGCYLAPLRLLASELYDTLNAKGVVTTLLTGEEVIELPGSTHYSSTIEMARFGEIFDCVVIDEIQMMSDSQRGWAWTRALINIMSDEVHICGDASVLDLVREIVEMCGDTLEIKNYERMTKLSIEKQSITMASLQRGDALIVFSRRNALKYKYDLERMDFKVSIVYGRLGPEVRREQARKFDQGETDIIVSTDAIAMGMNLPIKRIVFSALSKFIDSEEYELSDSEIKQISGRAGRFKRFPIGFVTCLQRVEGGIARIEEAMVQELPQKTNVMVGPDLEIFSSVNNALISNGLERLKLSEFLRLFNTMTFKKPFYCVELKEMIELAEMVEEADPDSKLSVAETFGFACAPVNMGITEHVQYYVWILGRFVHGNPIFREDVNFSSNDIDYLETAIKCVELYQWLSRHFNGKHFEYQESELLSNKARAIEKLNDLLSEKTVRTCSSCGKKLDEKLRFNICDECFLQRRNSGRIRGTQKAFHKGGASGTRKKGGSIFKRKGPPKKHYKSKNKKSHS